MRGRLLAIGLAAALGAGLATVQALTQQQPPPELKIQKVKDDLYEIEGDGGNVAVFITDEGIILIDDKFEQDRKSTRLNSSH